ncbi:3-hydroxyacyl-CoA dehydrogenase family protein [Micromonospora sp. WMMD961]|uniref:3-hydroxyacyl-CoA dehydrogenase family protein n=1 Tax=Micromonospora sp. WMMD961 TaxID=3016100 RepID=UPI0024164BE5|nr:3-hydroxyacyl-CoA dehydrogenase family protein [Micromonospora sp. WMMD961]MDG4780089.1 3-hydroxyacyl-CoA dehydrogenase family protein [Micromonospora sp. WMMD961]
MTQREHRLAVLGAGTMGVGIATLAVGYGVPVVLVDIGADRRAEAPARVSQQLRMAQLMGGLRRDTPTGELTVTDSLDAVADATVVVESITERPEWKAKLVGEVTAVLPAGTPVLTNTSGIPVDELAGAAARPGDVLGAHFMNPPYLIRAIEVVRGPRTTQAGLDTALDLLARLEREPVVVGDGPGFVINRVLQRMINEASRIVQDGIADPAAVDALFTGCLGHRTGPLATGDLIGLDNVVDSLQVLLDRTGDEGYRPSELLVGKVRAGDLGRKTGRGFHDYQGARR